MNKAELIGAVAKKAGLSKVDAKKAIDAFVSETKAALKKKKNVTLVGFGTFSVNKRAARTGRNPQTGEPIKIPGGVSDYMMAVWLKDGKHILFEGVEPGHGPRCYVQAIDGTGLRAVTVPSYRTPKRIDWTRLPGNPLSAFLDNIDPDSLSPEERLPLFCANGSG